MFSFDCVDCGIHTVKIGEYYMVHNHLWPGVKMLCLGCLETRLGRQLVKEDFKDCDANHKPWLKQSERFLERLNENP